MRLNRHDTGMGVRTALLVHGAMADHGTWHGVEAELVARGYRVVGVDLRGHGGSPRGPYTPGLLGDDLADTLPRGADLAIGHSMGGLALSLAVERLRPGRAVYSDPALRLSGTQPGTAAVMRRMVAGATPRSVRQAHPRWSDADIEAELAGFARFDPGFLDMVDTIADGDFVPAEPVVPSLVQLADPSFTVDDAAARRLRDNGFGVRVVPGAGHCIHRDDLQGFMASLEGWV